MNNPARNAVRDVAERRLRRHSALLALGVACLLLACFGEDARLWARYDRDALAAGELWRLATAHWVHLGWGHLWPNLAALALIGLLFDDVFAGRDWAIVAAAAAAAIDGGLYVLDPMVTWYVGLSGVLHGFIAAGAWLLVRQRSGLGLLLAVGLVAKLLYEQLFGALPFTAAATGGPVIVAAHLYGAVGGLVAGLGIEGFRRRASRL